MQIEEPLITTIIPTFRRPRLLSRAIHSSLNQSFKRTVVRVYDNASGDETPSLVNEISLNDPRIRYYVHQNNIGAAKNFEFGLEHVDTPFFSFLSDDDLLLPGFYKAAMEDLMTHPKAAFFAGSVICMTDRGRILYVPLERWQRDGLFTSEEGFIGTIGPSYPVWTGIVFRTAVVHEAGGLDLSCGAAADLEFVSRIASRFPFLVSKKPCAICVNHPGSSSKLPKLKNIWPGWRIMMQKLSQNPYLSAKKKQEALSVLSIELSNILRWLCFHATLAGQFYLARRSCVILRKSGYFARARRLAIINRLGQKLPVLVPILGLMVSLRRKVLTVFDIRRASLNLKFRRFAAHLKK